MFLVNSISMLTPLLITDLSRVTCHESNFLRVLYPVNTHYMPTYLSQAPGLLSGHLFNCGKTAVPLILGLCCRNVFTPFELRARI